MLPLIKHAGWLCKKPVDFGFWNVARASRLRAFNFRCQAGRLTYISDFNRIWQGGRAADRCGRNIFSKEVGNGVPTLP